MRLRRRFPVRKLSFPSKSRVHGSFGGRASLNSWRSRSLADRPRLFQTAVINRRLETAFQAVRRAISPRPRVGVSRRASTRSTVNPIRPAWTRPVLSTSSSPCASRRERKSVMFALDVAGRSWGSRGGPSAPRRRTVESNYTCVR